MDLRILLPFPLSLHAGISGRKATAEGEHFCPPQGI